jgi:hypothetical protein
MTINGKYFKISGSIRWVNEKPGKPKPYFNEIGLSLISPPKEYLNLLDKL